MQRFPDDSPFHLGHEAADANRGRAGAIADFRKVLEISPGLSESLQRLGATQWRNAIKAIKGGADGSRAQDLCRRDLQRLVRFLRL
jgi:hypothetical protein